MANVILVPTYKPTERYTLFIEELIGLGLEVIAVNDGSGQEYDHCFDKARSLGVTVLKHEMNKGKGVALKTGFSYILENMPDVDFVVTADSDGQHAPKDILAVIESKEVYPDHLIIGGRFSKKDEKIPARSKFGNTITRWVFTLITGLKIKDTQTGLRGIPRQTLEKFVSLKGERFEYEMNMLFSLRDRSILFVEIPISTIYYDDNKGSHFSTFKDAWRIFKQILSFSLVSILSFILDYSLYCIFSNWLIVWLSYALARGLSSVFNLTLNGKLVFKNINKFIVLKYYILSIFILAVGTGATYLLTKYLYFPKLLTKIVVDFPLFFASFYFQKKFVFKKKPAA